MSGGINVIFLYASLSFYYYFTLWIASDYIASTKAFFSL